MFLDHFRTMSDYNRWANDRLYDACAQLPAASYMAARPAFFGSIHNTLNHIVVGNRIWLGRIEGMEVGGMALNEILFADFDGLRAGRIAEDDRTDRILAGMTEDDIAGDLAYRNQSGTEFRTPMRLVLTHFFNHQTHHRAQVHDMLAQTDVPPPELDLIYFIRTL